ncbi:hypothetical protein H4Q26_007942 [Puccinia striiformis f. sp. tritici PST-130]|nr:hypothetical protein H4Q26_007942 [Puccinia striiformis f. sp. tritici PST-130]
MDDEDGGSAGDQGHVVDDGFEGGSLDSGDEVVIETGIGDNRTEAAPWSWNGVLPFQPRAKIQAAPVDLGGHPTLLHQATDNVFGRPRTVALIVGWTFDLDPLTSGSLRSKTFSEAELVLLASRCLANLMEAPGSAHTVVHHGAVPVLCANLLEINFSDLAEQSLSTLEKISEELLSSIQLLTPDVLSSLTALLSPLAAQKSVTTSFLRSSNPSPTSAEVVPNVRDFDWPNTTGNPGRTRSRPPVFGNGAEEEDSADDEFVLTEEGGRTGDWTPLSTGRLLLILMP